VTTLSLFRSGPRQLAGLDISSSSLKLVELSEDKPGAYRLEQYAIEPLPFGVVVDGNVENFETVEAAMKRLARRVGGGVKRVAVALPISAVITKRIYLPAELRELEMEVQVESEASQYIPFALEEVNLDFQVVGPSPRSPDDVEVLIAASRKEKVEDRVAIAEAGGFKVDVVDVESFATEAAFPLVAKQLPQEAAGKIVALIDIGAVSMNVTMLRDGQQLYARDQAIGGYQLTQDISRRYGMSIEEAEAAKKSGTLPEDYELELQRPFMDGLALEVSRALQFFFTSTPYNAVDYIVLSGGSGGMAGLADVIRGRTQVETVVANPFAYMATPQNSSKFRDRNLLVDAPSLMVACGLALRRFDS